MAVSPQVIDLWCDPLWRLNNLYWIIDETGKEVPFRMNTAQEQFFTDRHGFDLILKARQLGFTTLIQIDMLDQCVFYPNISAGVIAHNKDDAQAFFRNKVKFPYERLPDGIKRVNPATQDAADSLAFANGSNMRIGTSLRSGTLQLLHISEYGKLCAKYPEKAAEVRTGALNTVHAGQQLTIESTAEGQAGDFYDRCVRALSAKRRGTELTSMDYKFHFFPWHEDTRYVLDADVPISQAMAQYFRRLKALRTPEYPKGIALTSAQKSWYVKKAEDQGDKMKREFPSTPEEAFEAAIEGAYYASQFVKLDEQNRIGKVPHDPSLPVETWWDLGMNDVMSIWFVQRIGRNFAGIDYFEDSGEGLAYYAGMLQEKQREKGYIYSEHLWPHDGNVRILDEKGRRRDEVMISLGYAPRIIPRGTDINTGIEAVRNTLPRFWFDEENCAAGLKGMRAYRKEWDEKRGTWKNKPLHNEASNPADAFRTGCADTYDRELMEDDDYGRFHSDVGRDASSGY